MTKMKRLALRALQSSGLFALARNKSARMARILMYHNFAPSDDADGEAVSVAAARSQLSYLTRHFQVVPLTHLVKQLRTSNRLDPRMVILTVDDGRRNFYEYFFPLLLEFHVPATFFVVSAFIGGEDWLWTDKVLWLAEKSRSVEELRADKIEDFFAKMNRLRPEARDACIDAIAIRAGVPIPAEPPSKFAPCSWSELREMADSSLVEIGSHSLSHSIFSTLTGEESMKELTTSRAQLEAGLGRPVKSFCFPNGKPIDYFPCHLEQVQNTGYSSAVMTHSGIVDRSSDPFTLPRIGVSGRSDLLYFKKCVDGVEYYQSILRKGRRLGAS